MMLVSWAFLSMGALSFASCNNDDDVENNDVSTQLSSVFEKYQGLNGASIDGDDVVLADSSVITLYHYSGDKIEKECVYIDYGSAKEAKAAYSDFTKSREMFDVQIEGTIVSYSTKTDIETMPDLSKEAFFNILTGNDVEGIVELFGNGQMGE